MADNAPHGLRKSLAQHLDGHGAHISLDDALEGFPFELAGRRPPHLGHSAWGLVYHLWICQWDILEYSLKPSHHSPEYPHGYWPKLDSPRDESEWLSTIDKFRHDLARAHDLVLDPGRGLDVPLRKGIERTPIELAILVTDHNSYHIGQLVDLRTLLGVPVRDW
ncbi:MAG TPA: DinB family protein [Rectinemataceae bacterium]|nr:DinB family protein [Rectinemataceae bacterium]